MGYTEPISPIRVRRARHYKTYNELGLWPSASILNPGCIQQHLFLIFAVDYSNESKAAAQIQMLNFEWLLARLKGQYHENHSWHEEPALISLEIHHYCWKIRTFFYLRCCLQWGFIKKHEQRKKNSFSLEVWAPARKDPWKKTRPNILSLLSPEIAFTYFAHSYTCTSRKYNIDRF